MMIVKTTAPNIRGCLSFKKSIGMLKTLLYFIPFEKMWVELLDEQLGRMINIRILVI